MLRVRSRRASCFDVRLELVGDHDEELVLVYQTRCCFGDKGRAPFGGRNGAHNEFVLLQERTLQFGDVTALAIVNAMSAVDKAALVYLLREGIFAVFNACGHHFAGPGPGSVGGFPLVQPDRAGPVGKVVLVQVGDLLAASSDSGIARVTSVGLRQKFRHHDALRSWVDEGDLFIGGEDGLDLVRRQLRPGLDVCKVTAVRLRAA